MKFSSKDEYLINLCNYKRILIKKLWLRVIIYL